MLKAITLAGAAIASPLRGQLRGKSNPPHSLLTYLQSLARDDGAYGWNGQGRSHHTPTFYVIGCYRLFGQTPPNKTDVATFVRTPDFISNSSSLDAETKSAHR